MRSLLAIVCAFIALACSRASTPADDDGLTTLSYGTGRLCQVAFAPARHIVWVNVRYPYSVVATQPQPIDLPRGQRATMAYACFERQSRSYLWIAAKTDDNDDDDARTSLIYEGTRLLSDAPMAYTMGGYDEYADAMYVVRNMTLVRMKFEHWLTSECANTTHDVEVLYDLPHTVNLTDVTKLTVIGGNVFLGKDGAASPRVQISTRGEATFLERHVEPAVCDALRTPAVDAALSSLLSANGASNLFNVLMLGVVVFFVYVLRYRLNIRHGATVTYELQPPKSPAE